MVPDYRHYGKVTQMGTPIWDNYDAFQGQLLQLREKEFEITIRERVYPATQDQHGYYRAGIIREALSSNAFGGWTETDIHNYYSEKFLSFRVHRTIKGKTVEFTVIESTANIGKKRFAAYIDQVINDLLTEHSIQVGGPEDYVIGKYQTRKSDESTGKEDAGDA